jgi:tRNA G18 (ribose-2'-O)-methylase SpoU
LVATTLDDPRLADYRDLRDRRLGPSSGRFIAESEVVVRKLLAAGMPIHSMLLTAPRLASLEPLLAATPRSFPIFLVPQTVMDKVAGFHVHRGCLAIAERPRRALPADAHLIVIAVDLVDVDNLGSLARNAAAFGVDALMLSPRSADPYYRKAVRTSAGAVLALPIVRAGRWPEDLLALRDEHGFQLAAAVLTDSALPLPLFAPAEHLALLFGPEGPGLDPALQQLCDIRLKIPMVSSPGVDSLNVANASAVFLYHITQVFPRRPPSLEQPGQISR